MDRHFRPAQRILELGCGTGEDAVHLARRGVRVTAVDASQRMVAQARAKARNAGCETRIAFHSLPMESAGAAFRDAHFDGVFSNFGAVNCVEDLHALSRSLAPRVSRGGKLLWVVMGRHVPWEWAWYLAHGDSRRAFRRLRPHGIEWRGLRVRYPRPREVEGKLAPFFSVRHVQPLGCVLPPSYAAGWLEHSRRMSRALIALERLAQGIPWLANLADHYVIEAERTETQVHELRL
jgi:SAM-dependent methyltransferase